MRKTYRFKVLVFLRAGGYLRRGKRDLLIKFFYSLLCFNDNFVLHLKFCVLGLGGGGA